MGVAVFPEAPREVKGAGPLGVHVGTGVGTGEEAQIGEGDVPTSTREHKVEGAVDC